MMQEWAGDKRFKGLVFVFLISAIIALGAYAYLAYTEVAGVPNTHVISVQGTHEMYLKPDIATFSFSVMADEKTAEVAQSKSAEANNAILAYLKEKGVEEKDVKTVGYNINPKYEYTSAVCSPWGVCPPGKQNLVGYTVEQTVTVKVRKVDQAGDILSGLGEKGATNVSGLTFAIDDMEKAKADAREEAIKDAKEKATRLASSLGVRLGKLQSYHEDAGGYPPPYAEGYAGMALQKSMDSAVVPNVTPGENKVVSNVTLVYEIR